MKLNLKIDSATDHNRVPVSWHAKVKRVNSSKEWKFYKKKIIIREMLPILSFSSYFLRTDIPSLRSKKSAI